MYSLGKSKVWAVALGLASLVSPASATDDQDAAGPEFSGKLTKTAERTLAKNESSPALSIKWLHKRRRINAGGGTDRYFTP